MKAFSIADIRDVFRIELETYIATARENLELYLTPEGSLAQLDAPAVHAHSIKGVAATVHAWGLSWFAEDLEALYELARSLHNSEPKRARTIAMFIQDAIPYWQEMARLSLEGELDEAIAQYGEVRAIADKHWGGYLPNRLASPLLPTPATQEAEAAMGFEFNGETAEATSRFQPDLLGTGGARAVPQPKLRVVSPIETEPPAAPPSKPPKTEPEGETSRTVLVNAGAPGAARRVAAPQLKVITQEEPSEWNALIEECVSTPGGQESVVATAIAAAEMPGIACHLLAPTFQVAAVEPSEWEAAQAETPAAQPKPASQDSVEDELVGIFRDEAKGYLAEIAGTLTKLRSDPSVEAEWLELRRLCHTLKGSGATVGLDEVSEHCRAAEQLARTALEDSSARTGAQLSAIGEMAAAVAGLMNLDWTQESAPAFSLDSDLANAFSVDAFEQLDSLESALLAWERGEDPEAQRGTAYRAFHTLKGAANSIGLTTLGANLHLVEDLMEHSATTTDRARFSFLLETVDQLRRFSTDLQCNPATAWSHSWEDSVAGLSAAALPPLPVIDSAPVPESVAETHDTKSEDLEAELIRAFSFDARDQSAQCEFAVLAWERGEAPSEQIVAVLRAFHTLKGAAKSVGLDKFGEECHAVESLLDGMVGKSEAPADLVAFLLAAVDQISSFGELLEREPKATWPHDWQGEVARLASAIVGEQQPEQPKAEAAITPAAIIEEIEAAPAPVDYIRVKSGSVHQLLNQVGELVVERNRFAAKLDRAIQLRQLLGDNRRHLLRLVENFQDSFEYSSTRRRTRSELAFGSRPGDGTAAEFSELEMDRYDEFNMLSRALTEVADDLGQVTVEMEGLIESFRVDEKRFATNSRVMQEDITGLTSQPIEGLFRRLERSFRDALQVAQKEAVLSFEGARATLDRSIIERLHTPLLHLVRNAVAHGIEAPDEREAAGKARQGNVIVAATQSSNQIIITVRDDGAGISPERVLQRGSERGLVAPGTTELTPDEVLALLFTPGFSTAREITQVAGRGVGMDVVKRAIEEMKGSVSAEWIVGEGTTWKIQLPLTLAVSEAIIVELAGQEFALPLNFTASGILIETSRITLEGGVERYTLSDGQTLPLIRLARIFGKPGNDDDLRGVILALGEERTVLVVDRVLARREIVVKALDPLFAGHAFLEGATLDSQGRPLLILSAPALLRLSAVGGVSHTPSGGPTVKAGSGRSVNERITALVVDDSLSVRTVQNRLLTDLGCEVILANDGLAALEKLRQQPPDIIFTDLEMPRMNGYDLISTVRAHAEWNRIPMVLVTSRSAQKHLDKALELGAKACLTKPFTRDDLATMLTEYAGYTASVKPG